MLVLLGAGALAPAAVTLAGAATRDRGGAIEGLRFDVLEVSRRALPGHTRHAGPVSRIEATSWPDVVRVGLRVANLATLALLVSPGQFRLRVADDLSVMPTAWEHGPMPLAAGATRTGWIDYRAPQSDALLALEFTPAGHAEPVVVPLLAAAVTS
jgi:hypothetical protein